MIKWISAEYQEGKKPLEQKPKQKLIIRLHVPPDTTNNKKEA